MSRYDKYRPANINWLDEVPEHWELSKAKYYFKYTTGFTPPTGQEEFYNEGITWVTIADMNKKVVEESATTLSELAIEKYKPDLTVMGSLLYSFKLSVGKVAFAGKDLYTNEAIISILPDETYDVRYFYYTLPQQLLQNANENIYGAKMLNQELIRNAVISFPSKEEQIAIANHLDEKTEEIDKLIANKQQLIELLKEEKATVINEAVSGIGKNWERKKLKYIATIKYGLGQPPKQKDDGLPLIRATNVERGKINEKDLIFVDPDDVPFGRDPVLKENDIIVVRSGAYTADSAIIPKKFEGAITGYDLVVRVMNDNPFYIAYSLLSADVLINQLYLQRLRAAQPHLNREELGETLFNMPSIIEQDSIVKYLQNAVKRIEEAINKIEVEIQLMEEYKTALISEVATGKQKVI